MPISTLRIRGREYTLDHVRLDLSFDREGDARYLIFSLFADSQKLTRAGLAIKAMTIEGLAQAADLQGRVFELGYSDDEEDEDYLNELGDSAIYEPKQALELEHLKLTFGALAHGAFEIALDAVCYTVNARSGEFEEENIPVSGRLIAEARP